MITNPEGQVVLEALVEVIADFQEVLQPEENFWSVLGLGRGRESVDQLPHPVDGVEQGGTDSVLTIQKESLAPIQRQIRVIWKLRL